MSSHANRECSVQKHLMPTGAPPAEATVLLLRRVINGDATARDVLLRRYLPLLRRWAHGRLPTMARDLSDTDDLVQVTLIRALNHLHGFECRHPGAFLAYLRQILLNQVRDEVRRRQRRPDFIELDDEFEDTTLPTLLEQMLGHERLSQYETALARLPKRQQGLIVMRLELSMSYPEIAHEIGGTMDAARMMVSRAIVELAQGLNGDPDAF